MSASFTGDTSKLEALGRRLGSIDLGGLRKALAAEGLALVADAFARRTDAYGGRWVARNGAFQQRHGFRASFTSQATGDGFRVGSNFIGARLLTKGGTVTPKGAKRLRIPLAGGGAAYLKAVTIPARGVIPTGDAGPIWTSRLMKIIQNFGAEIVGSA